MYDKYISILTSKANSWDNIEEFFKNNEDIKSIYEEARDELYKENCQSASSIIILTIEKLIDKADHYGLLNDLNN